MGTAGLATPLAQLLIRRIVGITKDRDVGFVAVIDRLNLVVGSDEAVDRIAARAITIFAGTVAAITIITIAIDAIARIAFAVRAFAAHKGQAESSENREHELHFVTS